MKFKYFVVPVKENSSDKFNIDHCQIKVKVIVGFPNSSPYTAIQTFRSNNSNLVQTRRLILSMFVLLKYCAKFMNIYDHI